MQSKNASIIDLWKAYMQMLVQKLLLLLYAVIFKERKTGYDSCFMMFIQRATSVYINNKFVNENILFKMSRNVY